MYFQGVNAADASLSMTSFDVHSKDRRLPTEQEIKEIDFFIITGRFVTTQTTPTTRCLLDDESCSPSDAFSDLPWVVELRQLVANLFSMGKSLIGICFGHQLVCSHPTSVFPISDATPPSPSRLQSQLAEKLSEPQLAISTVFSDTS